MLRDAPLNPLRFFEIPKNLQRSLRDPEGGSENISCIKKVTQKKLILFSTLDRFGKEVEEGKMFVIGKWEYGDIWSR